MPWLLRPSFPPGIPRPALPASRWNGTPAVAHSGLAQGGIRPQWGYGPWFRDKEGRVVLMRGVNLGGSSKLPASPAHARNNFDPRGLTADPAEVSFVGRPFPLQEADEHFARLRSWGLTLLRFVITWEALEHAGPGKYDDEYIAYLVAVVRRAARHGIACIMDPHQDAWSRWSGGDGAPRWTLDLVGFDTLHLDEAGAAVVHGKHPEGLPKMTWPTSNARLASATMFTLFYAGDIFAPNAYIEGQPAQTFLQKHFAAALGRLAKALSREPNVLGFGTGNEPSKGYVGCADLRSSLFPAPLAWDVTAWEGMRMGHGRSAQVSFFSSMFVREREVTLNPTARSAWADPARDVWRNEGVWGLDGQGEPQLLRPDYFARHPETGKRVDFLNDCLAPLWMLVLDAVRAHNKHWTMFAEPHIDPLNPAVPPAPKMTKGNWAWAPHWYDAIVLMTKTFRPWVAIDEHAGFVALGAAWVRSALGHNVRLVRETGMTLSPGGAPTVIGETGIAMDLEGGRAYRDGDFSLQVRAMDRTMRAMEGALVSLTLWCYTADNDNERGDQWNGEDLSLWSRDQQRAVGRSAAEDLHAGGRALQSVVRPYAMRTAGTPESIEFDIDSRVFSFSFNRHDRDPVAPTVLFVPDYQYPQGFVEKATPPGKFERVADEQVLLYYSKAVGEHRITVRPAN
eukprot:TRINITY_DN14175_c0_g1_i1.p1 TRINITY_DN14175_c0_g1~~TRINITY_DN14175_c0_g1_i1.p1  ORF type:complete len:773 (+),score=218.31 TRINITY_DN14175_c0_g1_i1:283-2319(+)